MCVCNTNFASMIFKRFESKIMFQNAQCFIKIIFKILNFLIFMFFEFEKAFFRRTTFILIFIQGV